MSSVQSGANHDGKTDAGELKTLADLGIIELDLNAKAGTVLDNGNLVGLISGYKTADGVNHQMADVWFAKDVTPASTETKTTVSLGDLLAAPSSNLLMDAASAVAKPAADTTEVNHLAMIDRRLLDDDEFKRNGPLI